MSETSISKKMDDFTPRNYQMELMKIGLESNTIIYLPTGSGKTFIAILILKQLSGDLINSYGKGGKISIILTGSIPLVEQHAKYVQAHTNLTVGQYTGDMNLDFWPKDKWYEEYEKCQVLVMTSQILLNNITQHFIDLNKVNLLIFDECHRGVNDDPMRQIMKTFVTLSNPPRIIGLTATLLNGNCKPQKVLEEVKTLEVTFHSKVASAECLSVVLGYSTNPHEVFMLYKSHSPTHVEQIAKQLLTSAISVVRQMKTCSEPVLAPVGHVHLDSSKSSYKKLANLVHNASKHIETMGCYGGMLAAIAYSIQIERLKRQCENAKDVALLNYVETSLLFVKQLFETSMKETDKKEWPFRFSSDKILKLFSIIDEFKTNSKEELCAIIFTKERFTAKIIYYILMNLSTVHPDYSHVKPDYMVGYNCNPFNSTKENLYASKKNRQVLKRFENKEINLIVASNVLEEGVDIPKCSLVVKYDKPEDYRSYIQSKGRARHKDSFYYMMVENNNEDFRSKYVQFQQIEEMLNEYLMGSTRSKPSETDIQKMYEEDELTPYFVSGPGSAQLTITNAISLLCQYCTSLPSDIYTIYAPDWFEKKEKKVIKGMACTSVAISLPIICPYNDLIEGQYMPSQKSAKRAAAFEACKVLHRIGELDDHLLPIKHEVPEEDVSFLFKHYPTTKEANAGNSKNRRLHKLISSKFLLGSIKPNINYYLHIVHLEPVFTTPSDSNDLTMFEMYTSNMCFGIITLNSLPVLCDFPIYVTLGTIQVRLKVNQSQVFLNDEDLNDVKKFHHSIFKYVLKIIDNHSFLILDNSNNVDLMLLVPVDKEKSMINMDVLRELKDIKEVQELNHEEKIQLQVSNNTYLKKIVSPWHRRENVTYIVTEVCLNKDARSPFPNEDFKNYIEYFKEKYEKVIIRPDAPLLLVKSLTKRLNFIKPKGKEAKRKRDRMFEETIEHLPPELVVKQDFPSSLWIQANFIPTIISRISHMLRIEELRMTIAREVPGLGTENLSYQPPLTLDEYLLDYVPNIEEEKPVEDISISDIDTVSPITLQINKEFGTKLLEAEYPWKDTEEPKDIERHLDVNLMDIEHYERFLHEPITSPKKYLLKNENPLSVKHSQLALTYEKDFIPKPIKLLENTFSNAGPTNCDFYRALTAAKANDIVNLERLETLGDSFLKWITSVYVVLRFPKYNEGHHTYLKGRIVSNKNLYYVAAQKNLGGIMKFNELTKEEWLPPAFTIPSEVYHRIEHKEISVNALFNISVSSEEQISGKLSPANVKSILEMSYPPEAEETSYTSMACFLKSQYIGDKHIADVVESLLGVYIKSCGTSGGIKFLEWMGIIPKTENLENLLNSPSPNPVLKTNVTTTDILFHLPQWQDMENIIGYNFKNSAYLLQAFTHSSYSFNRITLSYEKLEFLGDAVLDFLITCYIYESCGNLDPGQLTDLRSALVNNNTFATIVVRYGLHKFLLISNSKLQGYIDRFEEFLKSKNYEVDDEVLILLEEDELFIAEYVDVPKALGDVFEAIAGAIYLDSGKNLQVVWNVFSKLMWREIDKFSQNVPKNIVRRLFEMQGIEPKFGNSIPTGNNKCLVPLRFLLNGSAKFVHGCGSNKTMAKKAAAKLALRTLGQ